jgi:DNA modification methylase
MDLWDTEPEEMKGLTDEDDIPEAPQEPITKLGDVWILGEHRVMCGDSTSKEAVEILMDGKKATLIHADPPYGMGKEKDGVLNDNIYKDKLDVFQLQWWKAFRPYAEDNASAYIWGNAPDLWRLWYRGGLESFERLTLRNEIVWDKKHGEGMNSDKHRMFPTATERCLFFMIGEQGFNNNADNYWEGFEPIRKYLKSQRDLIGWNNKVVAGFFGFHPRMADHWFSKSQWSFPQEDQYKRLQKECKNKAFAKDYEVLKQDYEVLKQEFYSTRAYFNNTHDNMTEVWEFERVQGEERHGHATPKPVEMMERVMKSSAPENAIVVEPFLGSGSTLIAAEKTKRKCYGMELDPKYCDVIVKRWEDFTGKKAKKA